MIVTKSLMMLRMLRRARVTKKDWNLNDSQRRFYDPPTLQLRPSTWWREWDATSGNLFPTISMNSEVSFKAFQLPQSMKIFKTLRFFTLKKPSLPQFDALCTNGLVKHPFLPKMHLAWPLPLYWSALIISFATFELRWITFFWRKNQSECDGKYIAMPPFCWSASASALIISFATFITRDRASKTDSSKSRHLTNRLNQAVGNWWELNCNHTWRLAPWKKLTNKR